MHDTEPTRAPSHLKGAPTGAGRKRVRRLASAFVLLAGFLSLVSAFSEPLRDRLDVLDDLFPLAVPETAAALAALGGVCLLVLARGVRRGQRRAWAVCVVVLLAVAVLHLAKGIDVEEAAVALGAAAFLLSTRRCFEAASDSLGNWRGLVWVLGAGAATVAAGTLALEADGWIARLRHHFAHGISWGAAVLATVGRMVGIDTVQLPRRVDEFFAPAMATASAGLLLLLLVQVFRPVVHRGSEPPGRLGRHRAGLLRSAGRPTPGRCPATCASEADLGRARRVVARHGSGTLDYFALRPDKEFFFWGETVVAHAVYGGVCLVSPDPVGPAKERSPAWRAFRAYADSHGWALGVLGAGEEWLPVYRESAMHEIYVGDEAVVRAGSFSLEGGRKKGLRQAVNRVAKYGYTASFHDPSRLDPELEKALLGVMSKSRRGEVERGFSMTLGRVFDPADEGLLLVVVHAPPERGGIPVAFCQFVPAPGIGGFSLDLMRRDAGDHPNGLIDFALVETLRWLGRHGYEGLGLNFATMRAVLAGEAGSGLLRRGQAWAMRKMSSSMQIESLWRFNAKYDPDWLPRYAVYDAPEHALEIALAVARAESFWELPVIGRFLVPGGKGAKASLSGYQENGQGIYCGLQERVRG